MEDIFSYISYTISLISSSYYGDKLILKGDSVLVSELVRLNRLDLYRLTSDIDIHCNNSE